MKQTVEKDLYYEHYEHEPDEKIVDEYQYLLDDFINYCIKNNITEEERIKKEYKQRFRTNCSVLWWIEKEINKRINNESTTNN